jgi:hypothetical protein
LPVLIPLSAWLWGCQYESIRAAQFAARDANLPEARRLLEPMARSGFSGSHEILAWLEWGTILHDSGDHAGSTSALLSAEAGFDEQDRRPRTSISEEFWAAATNPQNAAYRGSPTDRVLAPTIRGVNSLIGGDLDGARSAFNEASLRQSQALDQRREQIDAAKAARSESSREGPVNIARSAASIEQNAELRARFSNLERFEPYRDFVNPFTELLHGVVRLGARRDAGDDERAVALLRSVAGMVPDHPCIGATLLDAEASMRGIRHAGVTHVFFATGFAPWRDSFRIDLPLFLFNDEVDYFGFSFPTLVFDDDADRSLTVETIDELVRTEVVAEMDRLIAVDFREELPALITRAVIGTAAKIAASWGLNRATSDDETLNTAVRIAAGLYLLSQNRADTRSWSTIPKQYQYARVRTPGSGEIRLSTLGGRETLIRAEPGAVTLVFVRSARPGVPLRVQTVVLHREVSG